MLDEQALRKPSFSEGYSVVLADGQSWTFPKPWLRIYPKRVNGKTEVYGGPSYGEIFDRQIEELAAPDDSGESAFRRIEIKFQIAVDLLLLNYDLDDDALATLLIKDDARPETIEAWDNIDRVIMGLPPKEPSPSGSDAPS